MRLLTAAASVFALASAPALAKDQVLFDIWQSNDADRAVLAIAAIGEKAPFAAAAGADKTALDLLANDEASLAIAELRARAASKVDLAGEDAPDGTTKIVEVQKDRAGMDAADPAAAGDEDAIVEKPVAAQTTAAEGEGAQKIVLVKAIVAAEGDKAQKKEIRRIIKIKTDKDMSDDEIAALIENAKTEFKGSDSADIEVETAALEDGDADAALLASAKGGRVMVIENNENGAATRLVSISGADAEGARSFIEKTEGLDDAEKAKLKSALGL